MPTASLAKDLDVSRNTVSEALRILELEGLVSQIQHKGVTVRRLTALDVRDIYCARRALEERAVAQSSALDDAAFAAMEAAVAASEQAEQAEQWRESSTASLKFHQELVATLGSRRLDKFFFTLLTQLRLAWAEAPDEKLFQRAWAERDRSLYDLMRRGERFLAIGALQHYLEESEHLVLSVLRGLPYHRHTTEGREETDSDSFSRKEA